MHVSPYHTANTKLLISLTWLFQRRISHLSPNDISLCTLWNMHVVNLFIWIVLLKFILLVLFLKIPFYYNGQNVYDFLFLWKKRSPENSRERERERNNCFGRWIGQVMQYLLVVSFVNLFFGRNKFYNHKFVFCLWENWNAFPY